MPQANRYNKSFFLIILGILFYLSFLIIKPFASYLILATVIAVIVNPLYRWLEGRLSSRNVAAALILILVLLILILPASSIITALSQQAARAYDSIDIKTVEGIIGNVNAAMGTDIEIEQATERIFIGVRDMVIGSLPGLVGSITDALLGIFVMFFTLFYLLIAQENILSVVQQYIPLKPENRKKLFSEMQKVAKAVILGQFFTALIQGTIGGIGFFLFGFPQPIFWGFVMVITAFIPFLGTPIVWAPTAIVAILNGNYVAGIGLAIYGAAIVMNVDNLIRPRLVADASGLHPILALLGAIGGIYLFGILGFIIGPLVLAFTVTMLRFFEKEVA